MSERRGGRAVRAGGRGEENRGSRFPCRPGINGVSFSSPRADVSRPSIAAIPAPSSAAPPCGARVPGRSLETAPRVRPAVGLALAALVLGVAEPAFAYIGPGAGFAFAGSLLMLVAALGLAVLTILLWPLTTLWRLVRIGNPFKEAIAKRVVIVGFDG